ncbi:MAG: hypothetical protein ACOC1K_00485 [Nanoarchaeota archaeon]
MCEVKKHAINAWWQKEINEGFEVETHYPEKLHKIFEDYSDFIESSQKNRIPNDVGFLSATIYDDELFVEYFSTDPFNLIHEYEIFMSLDKKLEEQIEKYKNDKKQKLSNI